MKHLLVICIIGFSIPSSAGLQDYEMTWLASTAEEAEYYYQKYLYDGWTCHQNRKKLAVSHLIQLGVGGVEGYLSMNALVTAVAAASFTGGVAAPAGAAAAVGTLVGIVDILGRITAAVKSQGQCHAGLTGIEDFLATFPIDFQRKHVGRVSLPHLEKIRESLKGKHLDEEKVEEIFVAHASKNFENLRRELLTVTSVVLRPSVAQTAILTALNGLAPRR